VTQFSHKVRLYPNQEAEAYLRRSTGAARFSWNWGLASWNAKYRAGEKTSGYSLVKEFNSIKSVDFPWTSEISKWATQKPIQEVQSAFKRFFSKLTRRPKFKKKGKCRESFYISAAHIKVSGKYLKLPKLPHPIKMAQSLRFDGELRSVVISKDRAGDWWASFSVILSESDLGKRSSCKGDASVGVDLGLSSLATLSTEEKIENPRTLKTHERKLKRLQRDLSRKRQGSSNRAKARRSLARAHRKVSRVRLDYLHKLTSWLVKTFRTIGIEDLNVRGMVKNHRLAKALQDAAFREFRRQLEYKAPLAGSNVALAPRFYPSSKLCSSCGHRLDELPLGVRDWVCPACGAYHDRDENAAMNLNSVAQRYWETLNACGEEVRPQVHGPERAQGRRRSSMKQESSSLVNQEFAR
jgi:putative transposase